MLNGDFVGIWFSRDLFETPELKKIALDFIHCLNFGKKLTPETIKVLSKFGYMQQDSSERGYCFKEKINSLFKIVDEEEEISNERPS